MEIWGIEGLQMCRVEWSKAGADKSHCSHTLTGWIETPQILCALLNFTEMKVGGKNPAADVIGQSGPTSSSPTDNIFQDFTPCQRIGTTPAPLFANCLTLNIHNLYIYTFWFYFQQPLGSCCQWRNSCSQMFVKSKSKYKRQKAVLLWIFFNEIPPRFY